MSIELDSFVLAGQESDLDSEFQLELEPETNMDADKEVRQRLLDGRESSSYTDLSYSRASKDTSLLVLELDDDVPSQQNPFLDPEVAERYAQIYEDAEYECRHAFDPKLTWTREEEKAIVRKIDWHVCLWACVMFFGLQVDRGNLIQAVSDNMLDDLGLSTNDYNTGNIIFYISFLMSELPSQLVSKAVGPDRWIPIQISLWSIVATSQSALQGRRSFFLTRSLLGILEGGFIPDIVLWLSYFYTSRELPTRLSLFWTTLSVTEIFGSFLAFGVLHMRGVLGWGGWRWLFLIEGSLTLLIGLASFFKMPASAVETKTWFRPKGWFSDREVGIVVNRVLRDDPSKGDMHNRQAITLSRLWSALSDYDLWPIYLLGLLVYTPMVPIRTYITLTLKGVGFDTFVTNLLIIPYNITHILMLNGLTHLSERLNERSLVSMIQPLWVLPCILTLRFWSGAMVDAWGTYSIMTVLLSYPYAHAILVGWTSKNSNNVGTRTVSAAVYNMSVQMGNVIGNNVFRADDAPRYTRGYSVLLGLNLLGIALFLGTKVYYIKRNQYRDRVWAGMTDEQREDYIKNSPDTGSKRLDFRFAH
ncbi:Putative Permease of the major facilitator superfamily [Aspergillus calidoustus]|uniref:Putative Permease of the major facilitator superfamily n=1 Tax=Aspergillus calidoustus TaxID=454130 RepID=A0A0U5GEQ8_ASPCI|nr:Putative Permease of the major facilitator superfamily [Aspergillus calidoustus]